MQLRKSEACGIAEVGMSERFPIVEVVGTSGCIIESEVGTRHQPATFSSIGWGLHVPRQSLIGVRQQARMWRHVCVVVYEVRYEVQVQRSCWACHMWHATWSDRLLLSWPWNSNRKRAWLIQEDDYDWIFLPMTHWAHAVRGVPHAYQSSCQRRMTTIWMVEAPWSPIQMARCSVRLGAELFVVCWWQMIGCRLCGLLAQSSSVKLLPPGNCEMTLKSSEEFCLCTIRTRCREELPLNPVRLGGGQLHPQALSPLLKRYQLPEVQQPSQTAMLSMGVPQHLRSWPGHC